MWPLRSGQQDFSDVSTDLATGSGTIWKPDPSNECLPNARHDPVWLIPSVVTPGTAFPTGLSISPGDPSVYGMPLVEGCAYPIPKDGADYYRIARQAGSIGTLRLTLWDVDPVTAQVIAAGLVSDSIIASLAPSVVSITRVQTVGTSAAATADTVDLAAPGAGLANVVVYASICGAGAVVGNDGAVEILDGAGGSQLYLGNIGLGQPEGPLWEFSGAHDVGVIGTADTLTRLNVPALGAGVVTRSTIIGFVVVA